MVLSVASCFSMAVTASTSTGLLKVAPTVAGDADAAESAATATATH